MATTIRLSRKGRKKLPFYAIVVQDKKNHPQKGFIEKIGYYNAKSNPIDIKIDMEALDKWISQGAKPSARVAKLVDLVKNGKIAKKPEAKGKKFAGKFVKEAPEEAPEEAPKEEEEEKKENPAE